MCASVKQHSGDMIDDRVFYSIEGALLFIVLSCPLAYRVTNTLLAWVTPTCVAHGPSTRPTVFGVMFHAVVFAAVAFGLLHAKHG